MAAAVGTVLVLLSVVAVARSTPTAAKQVAILSISSPSNGTYEAARARDSGLEPVILGPAEWVGKTVDDFKQYAALVLPERSCGGARSTLVSSKAAWSAAATGNKILIGSDPSDHGSGGRPLVANGILFAASGDETGLYAAFECDNNDAGMVEVLDAIDGTTGEFATQTAGCYNRSHRVADHPAFAETTDASLSNWSCSVHNAFTKFPDRWRVLAIAQELGTFTAPDGTIGLPYVLAQGQALTYAGRDLTAVGDSVSAGEGIGYGYKWNKDSKRWEDKNGSSAFWDVFYEPIGCHQSDEAHPRVLATLTGATLKEHLSCTGATFDEGLKGRQDTDGVKEPQIGGFADGPGVNQQYVGSTPDLVTVSIGANDIQFSKIVTSCFYPVSSVLVGTCGGNLDTATTRVDGDYVSSRLTRLYKRIQDIGDANGKRPLILHTQYVNPFPASDEDEDCFDVKGGWTSGFARDDINKMVTGLNTLNRRIKEAADAAHGVMAVPANPEFADHRFCSDDPWVFGMDTGLDPRASWTAIDLKTAAPFHPTIAGQAAIARQIKKTLDSAVSMRRSGELVEVAYASGPKLTFARVNTAGTTIVVPKSGSEVPAHPNFRVRDAWEIDTAADFSGAITVSLPASAGDSLWHHTGGRWEQVQSTFDGSKLQGSVTSLSPFAVGPAVDPIHAAIGGGEGGVAPEAVALTAAPSTGAAIDEVAWDFGDGTSATGIDVTHAFRHSGTYTVQATVRSVDGAVDTATRTVTITNPAPVLRAEVPATGTVGEQVELDSRGSTDANGKVERGWWELDGVVLEPAAQLSTLTLEQPGSVTVEAVVRDDELKETRRAFTITVERPQTPSAPGGGNTGGGGGGSGGGAGPSPQAGFSFASASGPDILLTCARASLLLTEVSSRGSRLRAAGVAARALAGQTVQLRRAGKRVASAKVRADGTFGIGGAARAGQYTAVIGNTTSPRMALQSKLRQSAARRSGGSVTLSAMTTGTVIVERMTACGQWRREARAKASRNGRFKATVKAPPAAAVVYRLRAGGRQVLIPVAL
ncbi:PKD domain-containing protein [Solirubrobacter deserti]|uniref:PKD domain-containing protein n=1 Tax=Solirubrobacter deserti TaxID=2282478 RepID=A0ABT4RRR7_9ACTN|nr:PKD domain-containing protein [Solirubrobacter deserti]MDA0141226.1 PKD domain-containing protein [Solirubrobacter deserti]